MTTTRDAASVIEKLTGVRQHELAGESTVGALEASGTSPPFGGATSASGTPTDPRDQTAPDLRIVRPPAVERLVAGLDERDCRPRPTAPDQWMACCPAHDHRTPSLSIAQGDKCALVCCHAGCDTSGVVAALGLTLADLYDDRRETGDASARRLLTPPRSIETRPAAQGAAAMPDQASLARWQRALLDNPGQLDRLAALKGWTPEVLDRLGVGFDGERVTFPVRDGDGALVNVLRYLPGGSPKTVALKGRPRDLFPAPEAIEADELWIVEGEPDAVSAAMVGLAAIGLPGVPHVTAVSPWRFYGRRVVIALDCDPPGRTAAHTLASRLTALTRTVRVLDLDPLREDGYDLGDLVRDAADYGPDGLACLRGLLDRAAGFVEPFSFDEGWAA